MLESLVKLADFAAQEEASAWQPRLFNLASAADKKTLGQLLDKGLVAYRHDTIAQQLEDFVKANAPSRQFANPADMQKSIDALLGGQAMAEYGTWVYYPWSARLVHVLPKAQFRRLRSDRNRYKITAKEQERLQSKCIGIVGLSVGSSVALTMVLESIGGAFRLADFDALSLSNLNRLRAGVQDLGTNKAVLAARQMFELDPYLDIQIFTQGISDDNVEAFFDQGGPLDLLIEESDDLWAKVRLREVARACRVPVLMDTSDRGLVDIERFDLEPERPLFHGLAAMPLAGSLKGLSFPEKVAFLFKIFDPSQLSAGIRASLPEIKKTIEAWPQLGSAVTLGGGIATDVARRMLLGTLTCSGRFYVDLETLVRD